MFSSQRKLSFELLGLSFFLYSSTCFASTAANNASNPQIRPYIIDVDPVMIEATRQKAAFFRPTIDIDEPIWTEGAPSTEIVSIAKYWSSTYNWTDVQKQINTNFTHYMATGLPTQGNYNRTLDVHFIHQQSERDDAIPLLMLHGWPSSSLEWKDVILSLVSPPNSSTPAFHVVAPDMPGYGFSPAAVAPGMGVAEHSVLFANLMASLNYTSYAVYSTDLGFFIAQTMVPMYESRIINHITDFYIVAPNATDTERYNAGQTTPEETAYIAVQEAGYANHSAYFGLHKQAPLSVAHALNDSPVGFLAWMYEVVYTDSDQHYTEAELITQAMLLYLLGVYGNIRSYRELTANLGGPVSKSSVPTSVLQFGGMSAFPDMADFSYTVS